MKHIGWIIILLGACLIVATSCTDNKRARSFGGTETINLPAGEKLVNITWKESNIWILTVPSDTAYVPQTYQFKEKSSLGLMEGTITIQEYLK